jgi:hypothetical protein
MGSEEFGGDPPTVILCPFVGYCKVKKKFEVVTSWTRLNRSENSISKRV